MSQSIIQIKNLSIGYQSKKHQQNIAHNINITIEKGSLVALIGKNGSGKSTLLKTLNKISQPLQGNILIDGLDMNTISQEKFASLVAVVLTENYTPNELTVYETVALGRYPYTNWYGKIAIEDEEIIQNSLILTDTVLLKDRQLSELSDGQKQRVMIARAICQDTPLILLDEPTSHLDLHHKIAIFNLLEKICKEQHKTIIVATHEINIALKRANQLMIMNNGCYFGETSNTATIKELEAVFCNENIYFDNQTCQFIF